MPRKIGTTVRLRQEQVEWLDEQPQPNAEVIRDAIDAFMEGNNGEA